MHRVLHFPGQSTSTSESGSEPRLQLWKAHAGGSARKVSGQPVGEDRVVITTGRNVEWTGVASAKTEAS